MTDTPHLAVEANKKSIQYAMEGNKEGWLALYTEDAVVSDPVGKSPMDPAGNGHQGKAAIERFWDTVIGKANIEIRADKRWTSGDYHCCVAQVYNYLVVRDLGSTNGTLLATFTGPAPGAGAAFGIAVTELTAIGRPEWPAVTMVVFRNYQWGAEKRNSTLWYDDNFVGTELDEQVSYAGIARACGLQGVQAQGMEALKEALAKAVEDQMKHGKTTLIEALINVGVVLGLLPTKGLPLPFISYGGSGVVTFFALLAPMLKTILLLFIQLGWLGANMLNALTILGKLAMADIFLIALLIVAAKGVGVGYIETDWGLYMFSACILLSLLVTELTKRKADGL